MTPKQVTVGDNTYQVAPITLDQAEDSFLNKELKPMQQNRRMVAACLNNANSGTNYTEQMIGGLPFGDYAALLTACLEVNGLKPAKGEDSAAQGTKV